MNIYITDDKKYYDDCVDIRNKVFVEEQGVPADLELDEYEEECVHIILLFNDEPAGTVRYRVLDDSTIKVERMAVLKEYRKLGFGHNLMTFVHIHARQQGYVWAKLGAQTHAIKFYNKLGYEKFSDEYLDTNIPHIDMIKQL
ncbi:GNAT family N-acetyltransferase [Nosocomiicoccus massiliensis]|uniref:GNAT family N-acetyltransferase n=1 Tax=Nosocomiicoccus massiliensis TaxID=1232430 RepID=UPI0004053B8F|nr:GNAT family N-acetyltransferase [Nosocomiicoccus massiliensis]